MGLEQPIAGADSAAVDMIETRALGANLEAQVIMAQTEAAHAQAAAGLQESERALAGAEAEAGKASNNAEFETYSSVAMEAVGLKGLDEMAKITSEVISGSDLSDKNFKGLKNEMLRKPGHYANGVDVGATKHSFWGSLSGKGKASELLDRAGLSEMSLTGQAEAKLGAMKGNFAAVSGSAAQAKQLVYGQSLAAEQTLGNVAAWRAKFGNMPQAPGMGMGGGGARNAVHDMQRNLELNLMRGPKPPSDAMLTEEGAA